MQQHQAAVEEVAEDTLGWPGRLTDGDVTDQVGMRQSLIPSRDHGAQLGVQRQPQPVSEQRLMQGGMAGGERKGGRLVEDVANLEVLEMGTVGDDPLGRLQILLLDVTTPALPARSLWHEAREAS